jgi:hypothetical protein
LPRAPKAAICGVYDVHCCPGLGTKQLDNGPRETCR